LASEARQPRPVSPAGQVARSSVGGLPVAPAESVARSGADRGAAPAEPANPPPADLGERFLTELSRHRRERPRPLPTQFEPLAAQITRGRQVRIATDMASRQALRAVGKVAATTDDVIHLSRSPKGSGTTAEVLAHELTHVAHPSPAPRFFADHRGGAEERRAEEIGRIMARAPVLPRTSAASDRRAAQLPVAPAVGPRPATTRTVQRSTAHDAGNAADHANYGDISASALAARISGTGPAAVQRLTVAGAGPGAGVAPAPDQLEAQPQPPEPSANSVTGGADAADTTTDLINQFDRIVELLEERIIVELERRGGRFRGGF